MTDREGQTHTLRDAPAYCRWGRRTALICRLWRGHVIGRLEDELRQTLTVASVEGDDFTAQVVARVRQADERGLVPRISRELDLSSSDPIRIHPTFLHREKLDPEGRHEAVTLTEPATSRRGPRNSPAALSLVPVYFSVTWPVASAAVSRVKCCAGLRQTHPISHVAGWKGFVRLDITHEQHLHRYRRRSNAGP